MKHLKKGRKFGRVKKVREALLKSLAYSLLTHGRINTTEAKAKELKGFAEKIITHAKAGGLSKRRLVAGILPSRAVKKLFEEVAPGFKDRSGGYTRIIRLGIRKSDGARMAIIELVK